MKSVRISVSLPESVIKTLSIEVPSRQRSRFICEAVQRLLDEKRVQRLAADYRKAATEIHRVNSEMEGTINDGLD